MNFLLRPLFEVAAIQLMTFFVSLCVCVTYKYVYEGNKSRLLGLQYLSFAALVEI